MPTSGATMDLYRKQTALHDKWRRALEKEEFKLSGTTFESNDARKPMESLAPAVKIVSKKIEQELVRQKSVLCGKLSFNIHKEKIWPGAGCGSLVDEADLLLKIHEVDVELGKLRGRKSPQFNRKVMHYNTGRFFDILKAVVDRLADREQELKGFMVGGMKHEQELNEQIETSGVEKAALTQTHKVEMGELIQKHQEARSKFLELSMSFSQELHAMADYIQNSEIEKASLVTIHEAEKAELRAHIVDQAPKIEMLQDQVLEQESERIDRIVRNKVEGRLHQREVALLEEKHFYELQAKDKAFQELQNEKEKRERLQSSQATIHARQIPVLEAELEKQRVSHAWELANRDSPKPQRLGFEDLLHDSFPDAMLNITTDVTA
jgi:hypothetical protein